VGIPVIASGGAGSQEHVLEVFTEGRADAALAASIFHFAEASVMAMKTYLAANGVPMRLDPYGANVGRPFRGAEC
jgi:cyclase